MSYVEAFNQLGYEIEAPRQDWAAEKSDGVCISLWRKEMGTRDGLLWMATHEHADPIENWGNKPGNYKRIRHLRRAVSELRGKVDVVIVSGEPGVSYGTAWIAEGARAETFWQVSSFDAETGHFTVKLRRGSLAA